MSSTSIKRILSDIKKLEASPLENDGIFWHMDEDNVYNFKALIIGPSDTPYSGGFYFFNFNIPQSYPLDPPKVEYMTQYNKIRFNPNLYTNGKVCLSILNTWEGPSWTPCNTLSSILVSILGMVFVKDPLVNEPGFEHANNTELDNYNAIVEYGSLMGATAHMLRCLPNGFEVFKPKIEDYFVLNYDKYLKRAKELMGIRKNKNYYCDAYHINTYCDYSKTIKELKNIHKDITGIEEELPEYSDILVKELRELAKTLDINPRKDGKYKNKRDLYEDVKKKMKN